MIGHIGTLSVNPTLYKKLAYNPLTEFAPISTIATVANIMVVHPSLPAKCRTWFGVGVDPIARDVATARP